MTHPLVHPETPRVALASSCTLGEAPVWDHRDGTLLFVDIKAPAVWRWRPGGEPDRVTMAEPVGFVALTEDRDIVVAGLKSGLARLDLRDGRTEPIGDPEPGKPGNRLNDGHVGPDGVLYFGTMDEAEVKPSGAFWRFDGRAFTCFQDGICITNGPAISPDGRILYTVDSQKGRISAHALSHGVPGPARPFVAFEEGWGHPDGLAVDAEGYVWSCHWGGSRISRFAPDGSVERVLPVPTAQVSKCAFGGPDLTTLYITTAAIGRDPHLDPMAGHLFACDTGGIRGVPASVFGG